MSHALFESASARSKTATVLGRLTRAACSEAYRLREQHEAGGALRALALLERVQQADVLPHVDMLRHLPRAIDDAARMSLDTCAFARLVRELPKALRACKRALSLLHELRGDGLVTNTSTDTHASPSSDTPGATQQRAAEADKHAALVAKAHFNTGITLYDLTEWDAAARQLRASLLVQPAALDARLFLSLALMRAGLVRAAAAAAAAAAGGGGAGGGGAEVREAALVLQEAAEGAADEANVYVTAALLLLRTGNYSAAAIALAAVAQARGSSGEETDGAFSRHLRVHPHAAAVLPALLRHAAASDAPPLQPAAAPPPPSPTPSPFPSSPPPVKQAAEEAERVAAAVVYLTSDSSDDVIDLTHSLHLLSLHFFRVHATYPVIVLHDGLCDKHAALIRAAVPEDVQLLLQQVDLLAGAERWREGGRDARTIRRFAQAPQQGIGYRAMCRFFSGALMDLEIFSRLQVEYILRLDTDAFLPLPLPFDPFLYLRHRAAVYGYRTTALEEPAMAEGLLEFVRAVAKPPGPDSLIASGLLGAGVAGHWDGTFFYNNFEVLELAFFRSAEYRKLIAALDESGGFFVKRWGDGPVRTLALGFLANTTQVVKMEGMPYWHQAAVFL